MRHSFLRMTALFSALVSAVPESVSRAVFQSIPHADRRLFNIDGRTQYFTGTNAWWLGYLSQDSDIDLAMSQMASSGLKVIRVWGFGDVNTAEGNEGNVYFQILNRTLNAKGSAINFGPNGIPRLDSVVAHAEKYNLKLVLPMLNNWNSLGGIAIYNNAFGSNTTTFYTDTASQTAYRNYISFIIDRYKYSSAIFAWELCNEPRCHGCPTSIIYNWASSTSAYIKSLDASHMVAIGDEGWLAPPEGDGSYAYSADEGVDFIKNLGIPTIDYGTFHMYPDQWGYNFTWGNDWIEQHNAAGKAAGKPVVLEEYGSPYANNHTVIIEPWQDTVEKITSVAYSSLWQFATQFPDGTNPFDKYAVYYNETRDSDYEVLVVTHGYNMRHKPPIADM